MSANLIGACHRAAPTRRLAGWLPAGMIDWPGRVAPTVFLSGCDFTCPFCHNPQLVAGGDGSSSWTDLRHYLRRRRAWIDGVVISGGEPTFDPEVIDFLVAMAEEGVPVKLDTNGANPDLLSKLITDQLVTAVAVDVKTTFDRYHQVARRPDTATRVARTIDLVRDSGIPHEFRTTVYPEVIPPADLPLIAESLAGGDLYVIQQFRAERTLDPRAALVTPVAPDALRSYAEECSTYLPTITRGV